MYSFDPHDWQRYYQRGDSLTSKQVDRVLGRFRQSLGDWLHAALNWPEEDWQADLARFLDHSRRAGVIVAPESEAQLRTLLEARARGSGVFARLAQRNGSPPMQIQLAAVMAKDGEATDADVNYGAGPKPTFVDGVEVAGPGPETTESFKDKVRYALEILDPAVSSWWHGASVDGLIRSRNAWGPWANVKSYVEGDRPIIVVDQTYTAGQTAQAIIDESASGLFATSIAAHFRRHKFGRSQSEKDFQEWRAQAVQEAAGYASTLAEIYFTTIASLTPAGDLIVTVADIAENGFSWQQLLSVLPFLDRLPVAIFSVTLKFKGGRKVLLDGPLLKEFKAISKADLPAFNHAVKSSKTLEEAFEKLRQGLVKGKSAKSKRSVSQGAKGKRAAGNTDVYVSKHPSGKVQYVGITNNFAKRAAAHLREKGILVERLITRLKPSDARAVEQSLIEIYKLQRDGGTLINRINSISRRNPTYAAQVRRGRDLLRSIGYEG